MTVRRSPPRSDYAGHLTWTTTFLPDPPLPIDARTGAPFWPLSALEPEEPPSDTPEPCPGCEGFAHLYRVMFLRNCPDCHGTGAVSRETEE